jgi:hypothetical protein
MRPDRHYAPDDGGPNDQNIHRRQGQVAHPKLNRREDQVGHEIDRERQGNHPADLATYCLYENEAKANQYDGIENLPDEPNRPRCRRPRWLRQRVVPVNPRQLCSSRLRCKAAFLSSLLAIENLLQCINRGRATSPSNRSGEWDFLGANRHAVLGIAALLNTTLAHERFQPFVTQIATNRM